MKPIKWVARLSSFEPRYEYIRTISHRFPSLAKSGGDQVKGYELEVLKDALRSGLPALKTPKQTAAQNLVGTHCQRVLRFR